MTVMRAQIKNCTWVVLAVECIFEVQKVDEQWDAAKPSIDRPVLEICYLLGLADPGRYATKIETLINAISHRWRLSIGHNQRSSVFRRLG